MPFLIRALKAAKMGKDRAAEAAPIMSALHQAKAGSYHGGIAVWGTVFFHFY